VTRLALWLTGVFERWLPDAFVFALAGTVLIFVAGLAIGVPAVELVKSWGHGFPDLLAFTMQMSLVIVTGYVVATARPVARVIAWLADRSPSSPRAAVAFVTFFALCTAWVNWGFSLIFSAMLVREVARRRRGVDYRALAAASLLGLGSVWAQGLSGSAALQMATPGLLPSRISQIVARGGLVPDGIIDLSHTIFLWQSLASVGIEIVVVTALMWLIAPTGAAARDAATMAITLPSPDTDLEPAAKTPGEHLEHSPILLWAVAALGIAFLAVTTRKLTQLNVNTINLGMLLFGMILHGTPARLMRAVREAVPATWAVILQFPFYAAIAGMIGSTHLNERLAGVFVHLATPRSFPSLMAAYSALLGVFVPSGGSKWVIEAPYVLEAAHQLRVHLGWVVACYDLGEAVANLVQPFWMLPVLALLGLRARDVMGFTLVVFLVLFPLVLMLTAVLGATLAYPL